MSTVKGSGVANDLTTSNDDSLDLLGLSATVCAELAAGLSDVKGIRKKYNLSVKQWEKLKGSPVFRSMMREALTKFAGDMNAGRRIKIKAEVALEDSLPILYTMAHDNTAPGPTRLDAIKTMAQLAEAGKNASRESGGAGGVNINIQIVTEEEKRPPVIEAEVLSPSSD